MKIEIRVINILIKKIRMINMIKPILDTGFNDKEIYNTLLHSLYKPTIDKVNAILDDYYTSENKYLYGYFVNEVIVGIIGIECTCISKCVICHISIKKQYRNKGIASQLIDYIISYHKVEKVEAETDADAVEFYRKRGFYTVRLEGKHVGIIRYLCRLDTSK